jgi:rfaE bifunctional protein nucleotidyltransferase chain/domain
MNTDAPLTHDDFANMIGSFDYERIVFTNGVFDVIHPGHVKLLKFCHEAAGPRGCVVVGLNDDESVRRLKGPSRPVMDVFSRMNVLRAIRYVNFVWPFSENTPLELIRVLRPTVIVKGGDYRASEVVGRDVAPVLIVPHDDDHSTTKIIERMKG